MKIQIDPNALTLGELEELEQLAGEPISELLKGFNAGQYTAKALTALVYLAGRQGDPNFTIDDARNANASELEFGDEEDDDDAPFVEAVASG
jgi:hypothetical protein